MRGRQLVDPPTSLSQTATNLFRSLTHPCATATRARHLEPESFNHQLRLRRGVARHGPSAAKKCDSPRRRSGAGRFALHVPLREWKARSGVSWSKVEYGQGIPADGQGIPAQDGRSGDPRRPSTLRGSRRRPAHSEGPRRRVVPPEDPAGPVAPRVPAPAPARRSRPESSSGRCSGGAEQMRGDARLLLPSACCDAGDGSALLPAASLSAPLEQLVRSWSSAIRQTMARLVPRHAR